MKFSLHFLNMCTWIYHHYPHSICAQSSGVIAAVTIAMLIEISLSPSVKYKPVSQLGNSLAVQVLHQRRPNECIPMVSWAQCSTAQGRVLWWDPGTGWPFIYMEPRQGMHFSSPKQWAYVCVPACVDVHVSIMQLTLLLHTKHTIRHIPSPSPKWRQKAWVILSCVVMLGTQRPETNAQNPFS